MDFSFTEEQELLRESVRRLMERHAPADKLRAHDRDQSFPYDVYAAWAEAGLLALPFPEEIGGLGGSVIDLAIVSFELSRVSADLAMAYGGSVFCGLNILRKGSEEQVRRFLPPMMKGETRFASAFPSPTRARTSAPSRRSPDGSATHSSSTDKSSG